MTKIELFLDKLFNKIIPKKLMVFIIATWFAKINVIDGAQWTIIAGSYLGANLTKALLTYAEKKANPLQGRLDETT